MFNETITIDELLGEELMQELDEMSGKHTGYFHLVKVVSREVMVRTQSKSLSLRLARMEAQVLSRIVGAILEKMEKKNLSILTVLEAGGSLCCTFHPETPEGSFLTIN